MKLAVWCRHVLNKVLSLACSYTVSVLVFDLYGASTAGCLRDIKSISGWLSLTPNLPNDMVELDS